MQTENNPLKKLAILIPVYNDWEALSVLVGKISQCMRDEIIPNNALLVIVNDCSTVSASIESLTHLMQLEIVHLNRTLGHQKAIAIGLSYLAKQKEITDVIVMDADGEDDPADIIKLIDAHRKNSNRIIFAQRGIRQESKLFQASYALYKKFFVLMTGKKISFGNFCLIPRDLLERIIYLSEIWNHFSGGIVRSNVPFATVVVNRGKRFAGKSTMSMTNLVIHGLSSIAVHLDIVAVRLLVVTGVLMTSSLLGIVCIFCIKLFTDLAIPGWASVTAIGLFLICLFSIFISLFLSFMVLFYRMLPLFIPGIHYSDYVQSIEKQV